MTYFALRESETIERQDASGKVIKKQTLFFRELGYLEWDDLKRKTERRGDEEDLPKDARGLLMMTNTVLACVENEDGTPAYTEASWRRESRAVINQIGKRAMRAQGIDLDAIKDEEPMTQEGVEGNAEPSRKSGTNSPASSAAVEQSQS